MLLLLKKKKASASDIKELCETASALNKYPLEILKKFKVNACTDITGFGLIGHLLEMAIGAKKEFIINSHEIPLLSNAKKFAKLGLIPSGTNKNKDFAKGHIQIDKKIPQSIIEIMYDAQTSGGLAFSIDKKDAKNCLHQMKEYGLIASIIGEVASVNNNGKLNIY